MLRETCYDVSIHSVWRRKKGVALLLSASCDVECAKHWEGISSQCALVISHAPLEKNDGKNTRTIANSWLLQGLGPTALREVSIKANLCFFVASQGSRRRSELLLTKEKGVFLGVLHFLYLWRRRLSSEKTTGFPNAKVCTLIRGLLCKCIRYPSRSD